MTQQDNHFQLSRKSRAGALLLLLFLLTLVLVWRLLPALLAPSRDPQEKELQQAWEKFEKEHMKEVPAPGQQGEYRAYNDKGEPTEVRVHMASFDPNTASEKELVALGLPVRTARTLIRYRSKGGKFRRREDLQKLYTLSHEDYKRIAPYVRIPGVEADKSRPAAYEAGVAPQPVVVELNEADAAALIALRGIGPGYSRRILAFRDALGGFLDVSQLQEVYGFPDSTFQQLKDQLRADASKIKKINVNTATEEELARHPYIGRKLAANIVKLRNDLKNYADISQLRQTPLINEEKYRKIAPYLSTH
jgi:DNA uptake protein ComE-like DNA-binding protein